MPIRIKHTGDIGRSLDVAYLGGLGQFAQKERARQAQTRARQAQTALGYAGLAQRGALARERLDYQAYHDDQQAAARQLEVGQQQQQFEAEFQAKAERQTALGEHWDADFRMREEQAIFQEEGRALEESRHQVNVNVETATKVAAYTEAARKRAGKLMGLGAPLTIADLQPTDEIEAAQNEHKKVVREINDRDDIRPWEKITETVESFDRTIGKILREATTDDLKESPEQRRERLNQEVNARVFKTDTGLDVIIDPATGDILKVIPDTTDKRITPKATSSAEAYDAGRGRVSPIGPTLDALSAAANGDDLTPDQESLVGEWNKTREQAEKSKELRDMSKDFTVLLKDAMAEFEMLFPPAVHEKKYSTEGWGILKELQRVYGSTWKKEFVKLYLPDRLGELPPEFWEEDALGDDTPPPVPAGGATPLPPPVPAGGATPLPPPVPAGGATPFDQELAHRYDRRGNTAPPNQEPFQDMVKDATIIRDELRNQRAEGGDTPPPKGSWEETNRSDDAFVAEDKGQDLSEDQTYDQELAHRYDRRGNTAPPNQEPQELSILGTPLTEPRKSWFPRYREKRDWSGGDEGLRVAHENQQTLLAQEALQNRPAQLDVKKLKDGSWIIKDRTTREILGKVKTGGNAEHARMVYIEKYEPQLIEAAHGPRDAPGDQRAPETTARADDSLPKPAVVKPWEGDLSLNDEYRTQNLMRINEALSKRVAQLDAKKRRDGSWIISDMNTGRMIGTIKSEGSAEHALVEYVEQHEPQVVEAGQGRNPRTRNRYGMYEGI